MADTAAYRTIWRWHFYAGLFVLPFVLILSVTGAIYLFKPQIDRWEERDFRGFPVSQIVSPDEQLRAALAAHPGSTFQSYRLPKAKGDAAMVQLGIRDRAQREVFVTPQGQVVGALDPARRISATVSSIHGTLLLGEWGDRLVELVASWTIVMILTGLYLWWPRPWRAAGTLWPRTALRGQTFLRDLHRVTGFWIAGLVLLMLVSGLPWAGTWGSTFAWARAELGLTQGSQQWKIGAGEQPQQAGAELSGDWLISPARAHEGHDHGGMIAAQPAIGTGSLPLADFVARAEETKLAHPVSVVPPHAPRRFGPPTGPVWTTTSEARDPRLRTTITYDPATGRELSRSGFADLHAIDRLVSYGIAWHEGHLFGLANQIIGLLTALALIALSIVGLMMWLKRKPKGRIGAPVAGKGIPKPAVIATMVVLALLLPLFGLSLVVIWLLDRLIRLKARV